MAGLGAAEAAAAAGALLLLGLSARFAFREPEAFWWLTVALAPLAVPVRTGLAGAVEKLAHARIAGVDTNLPFLH